MGVVIEIGLFTLTKARVVRAVTTIEMMQRQIVVMRPHVNHTDLSVGRGLTFDCLTRLGDWQVRTAVNQKAHVLGYLQLVRVWRCGRMLLAVCFS